MPVQEIHESRISRPFGGIIYVMIQSALNHRSRDSTTDPSANTGAPDNVESMLGLDMPPDLISGKGENGRSFEAIFVGRME